MNLNGQETVFNKATGEWIDDGINDATYNIAGIEKYGGKKDYLDFFRHTAGDESDVQLWIKYGMGSNDKLAQKQREKLWDKSQEIYFNGTDEEIQRRKELRNQYLPTYNTNISNYWNNKNILGGE